MHLTQTDVRRLEEFLSGIQGETYPEPPSEPHTTLTTKMFDQIAPSMDLRPGATILDVGCGQGVALKLFKSRGFEPIGITVNPTDLAACREQGFDARDMDQSFLDFDDGTFDLVWCRHCLEHSIMPYFTLSQLVRVLKPTGGLYIEVPAPDTGAGHQGNPNHYSLLPHSAWGQLIIRAGIAPVQFVDITFRMNNGKDDTYWAFWGRRAAG